MNGQTAFAVVHSTDTVSSGQDDKVSPPPSESPKDQRKSEHTVATTVAGGESDAPSYPSKELGKASDENLVDKAKESSNGLSAAPKQLLPIRQDVSAHDRHITKAADNTHSPPPQPVEGNAANNYDQVVTKVSQPRATSKYGLSGAADATEISTKTAADTKMQAGETSPISDQSNADDWIRKTPSSPSSPSKKKKSKKKKKVS
jgi:hypothetical protein